MVISVLENTAQESNDLLKDIFMSTENNTTEFALHPLVKLSASFSFDSIMEKANNRLAVVFPRRFQSPVLITVLCGLELLKEKHEFVSLERISFPKEQKILLNGCLVEYKTFLLTKLLLNAETGYLRFLSEWLELWELSGVKDSWIKWKIYHTNVFL